MSAADTYLFLCALGAFGTGVAASRGRRPPSLGPLYFLVAWPVAELPLHHIVLSGLVTAGFAAAGVFQQWQGWLGLALVVPAWAVLARMHLVSLGSLSVVERALHEGLGPGRVEQLPADVRAPLDAGAPAGSWIRPFRLHDREHVERIKNLSYGPAGVRNRLDVYRPRGGAVGCPVLLQIHGGAWVFGDKNTQGLPLMNALARRGWVCVAPNYRLSPRATFPDHLVDCKLVVQWIREQVAGYGGDPEFIAVTGGSAGGHLAALLALSANDPEFQPGFEVVDTTIAAAVPFYGAYDFLHHNGVDVVEADKPSFVETHVMKSSPQSDPRGWQRASPIRWIHADAPPFFVLHGGHDSLVWPEGAREFVAALRKVSRNPVVHAELPGAHHAFDIFHSVRCVNAVHGVVAFLEAVRADRA